MMVEISSPDYEVCQISESTIEDICSFLQISTEECIRRLQRWRLSDMAQAWKSANPQTPEEIQQFYKETREYIWELTLWHHSAGYVPYLSAVERAASDLLRRSKSPRALDYGCGIGTTAIMLAQRGFSVDICDVPGYTFEFAKHRLQRRGLHFQAIPANGEGSALNSRYDLVLCLDVLEHIPRPEKIVKDISRHLRPGGLAVITVSFEECVERPCHLGDIRARFDHMLWVIELSRYGLKRVGWNTCRKDSMLSLPFRELRYWLWRLTGIYVEKIGRPPRQRTTR